MTTQRTLPSAQRSHFDPVSEYWSKRSVIKVWEAAFLMNLVEPSLASDLLVRDQNEADDKSGVPLDVSEEIEQIMGAIKVGEIQAIDDSSKFTASGEITRKSFEAWLGKEKHPAAHIFLPPNENASQKPLQRGAAQEREVLNAIEELGLDAMNLPKYSDKSSGAKKILRQHLSGNKLFVSDGVFEKTWERLSGRGEIRYSKE